MIRIISILLLFSILIQPAKVIYAQKIIDENSVRLVLNDYSNFLSTGKTITPSAFSNQIINLVKERRTYYNDFYETALFSKLLSLTSSFISDHDFKITQVGSILTIDVIEQIKFKGQSKVLFTDDYPMIKAAEQAILIIEKKYPDDLGKQQVIRKLITDYLDSTRQALDESTKGPYEITWTIKHEIIMESSDIGLEITQDSYSDKASDNLEGTDNVYWKDGSFYRIKPDFSLWPDYQINQTPIQDLTSSLLQSFEDLYNSDSSTTNTNQLSPATVTYNRTSAKSYIDTWVVNNTYTCTPDDSTIEYDEAYNYTQYYVYTCLDCANYVSQALKAGNVPTDGTWYIDSLAWKRVPNLKDYLYNAGRGNWTSQISLMIGDLGFILDGTVWRHAVMVSALSPLRYSAHTNDRRGVNWDVSINQYFHIYDTSS